MSVLINCVLIKDKMCSYEYVEALNFHRGSGSVSIYHQERRRRRRRELEKVDGDGSSSSSSSSWTQSGHGLRVANWIGFREIRIIGQDFERLGSAVIKFIEGI